MLPIKRAVQQGGTTVSAAAKQHSVPRKTPDDRIEGHVEHGANPGPSTVLTAEEEGVLVAYLLYMANHGFPLTVNMAKGFAWALALSVLVPANASMRKLVAKLQITLPQTDSPHCRQPGTQ